MLGKLPVEIKRNLARSHFNLEWTLSELKDSILTEIKVLESGLLVKSTKESSADNSSTKMTALF